MNRIRYRVLTELGGWSEPFEIRILPIVFFGGVNGTAFTVIGRRHPGAVAIELLAVKPEDREP